MRDHDLSQRRACRLVGVDPETVRRERPPDCADIRKEMQEIAARRRRSGCRRIGVVLERKGMSMNHSWRGPWPLWGRASPGNAPPDLPRGRAVREKAARSQASAWHKDPDAIGRGRQRALVVGLCIRQLRCLAEVPDPRRDRRLHARMPVPRGGHRPLRGKGCPGAQRSCPGLRQARLHCQRARRCPPLVRGQWSSGTEFTSRAILKWADENEMPWHDIDPGKPRQNAFIESFNGSLRDGDRIRSPQRGDLRQPGRRTQKAGALAPRPQYGPPALVPDQPDAAASAPDAWAIREPRARRACARR